MAVAGALAAPVAALAQVTLYGSIDTGIRQQSKVIVGAGDDSKLELVGSGKKSNRWGLKGSDDLGGGLMANFTLEGAYNSDDGADGSASGLISNFNRRAIVGLSKGGNSVDLGREYTLNFSTQGIWDPLSHDYGASAGGTPVQGATVAGTRVSNSITGRFRFGTGGVAVQYGLGEVAGPGASNDYLAISGDMAFGPVTVGAAFGTKETGASIDTTTTNIGGAYKMGAFTFRLGYGMEEIDLSDETTKLSGGVQYNFSPTLEGRVSYYDTSTENAAGVETGSAKVFVVNVEYSLSKRTMLYAAFDRKTLEGGQIASQGVRDGATGIVAGVKHDF